MPALLDPAPFAQYGYVEYADAHAYGEQASEAVAALRTLVADGRAAQAVALAGEAMAVLGETYQSIDDSSGHVGSVAADLAEAHLERAGRRAPMRRRPPTGWPRHLLGNDNDAFDTDPVEYREILGTDGLARLRQLATEAWRRKPSGWAEKYLMERLVKAAGNVDELIAVYAADLAPTGATHLQIAQELEAANRADEALTWAERGLRENVAAHRAGSGLDDFVCARYLQEGRLADATAVCLSSLGALTLTEDTAGLTDAGRAEIARTRDEPRPGDLVFQLLVELADVDQPPVWRRFLVPAGIRLDRLHDVLQAAMGWQNSHLHAFTVAGTHYGSPDPELGFRDERTASLAESDRPLCPARSRPSTP